MISVSHVSKSFGGIHAVRDCSLEVAAGSVTGLIGPNGAGKSTLFNIIAGLMPPDKGTIHLDGADVTGWPAHRLFHSGLARTFQIAQEFSRMTVIENLMAVPPKQSGENLLRAWFTWNKVLDEERALRDRAREVLEQLRLTHLEREYAGNLSGGQKKLLELGRALMREPRLILLDEIGAGINRTLLGKIAEKIKRLNAEHGYTFCLIEHDLDYVARLCGDVIVMAQGKVLTRGPVEEVRRDERVIEAYFGGGKYEERA